MNPIREHHYGNSDHCQWCGHEEGEPEASWTGEIITDQDQYESRRPRCPYESDPFGD